MVDYKQYLTYKDGELYWAVDRKKIPAGELATWLDTENYKIVTFPRYFDIEKKTVKAHRIIWEMFNSPLNSKELIDHIDGNPSNNRIENLRIATVQQNFWNKKAVQSASGLKGAILTETGKYRSRIRHPDGQRISLGTFNTAEEAQAAYIGASVVLFGEYAKV